MGDIDVGPELLDLAVVFTRFIPPRITGDIDVGPELLELAVVFTRCMSASNPFV